MKPKDRTVIATDLIGDALKALIRIDYDNAKQTKRNMEAAANFLSTAATVLEKTS